MSYKKGYNYANINTFCEKYKCELLTMEADLKDRSEAFLIRGFCGHESEVSFSGLMRDKKGVYCGDCKEDIMVDGADCFGCGNHFDVEDNLFYCSDKCAHTRESTNEQKQALRTTWAKKYGYYDKDGNLVDRGEEFEEMKKDKHNKNAEVKRREAGMEEQVIYTYEMTTEIFKKKGCKLLTTKDEFEELKKIKTNKRKFKIIGSCGHEIISPNFIEVMQKDKINCNECKSDISKKEIKKFKEENNAPKSMIIENNGVKYLEKLIEEHFKLVKTRECCKADVLIKPLKNENDSWLPIQLKITSEKCYNGTYKFSIKRKYTDMAVMLICVKDRNMWFFKPNEIKSVSCITIGGSTSKKYDNNLVTKSNIFQILTDLYNKKKFNINFISGNMPQTETAQLEYKYVRIRENKISFLNFTNNTIDGLVYDFKIENLKIQEKVCSTNVNKYKHIYTCLGKSNGKKINRKLEKRPYDEGDNDFYWLNIQNEKTFYVVPETELINSGHIATPTCQGIKNLNLTTCYGIISLYEFDYTTINEQKNKDRLLDLLGINDEKPKKVIKAKTIKKAKDVIIEKEENENENEDIDEKPKKIKKPKKVQNKST